MQPVPYFNKIALPLQIHNQVNTPTLRGIAFLQGDSLTVLYREHKPFFSFLGFWRTSFSCIPLEGEVPSPSL